MSDITKTGKFFSSSIPSALSRNNAFAQRPWRDRAQFAVAVFFLFSTVGILSTLINSAAVPMPARYVVAMLLCSGIFAAGLILFFGRIVFMLIWIAVFVVSMFAIGEWGAALQRQTEQTLKQPADAETRAAILQEYQSQVRKAILRDAVLTMILIVLSYIAFIRAFNHEWEQRSAVEAELKVARRIQESLLPPAEKRGDGWHMFGMVQPASMVAGDYFDYLELFGGKHAVLVADVSGHGVGAGLLMAMMKSQLLGIAAESNDTAKIFATLNQSVYKLAPKNMFVTAAYVALSPGNSLNPHRIEFATFGHPPILHYVAATHAVIELHTQGRALGLQPDLQLATGFAALQAGDVLLLHTDGLYEQMNAKKEQWGLERCKAELLQHHHLPLNRLCERLMKAGAEYRGRAPAHDDMTLVAMRCEATAA